MDKLIIHHGERVTEHELGDHPLVIGRDPQCDLFFADKKLSRHHARLERAGVGVRLVDLGSRNGSWVNDERVEERNVSPGDEIRLGGLLIHIERLKAAREEQGDESTIFLAGGAPPEDTGTVVLDTRSREAPAETGAGAAPAETAFLARDVAETQASGADASATVFLEGERPPLPERDQESDETLQKPEPERTVVLEGAPSKSPYDTGTVVFRGKADPSLQEAATRATTTERRAPDDSLGGADVSEPSLGAAPSVVPEKAPSGRSWAFGLSWIAAGLALFAFVVLALPLLRIARLSAAEESTRRARALVDLLAALNESVLGEGRQRDLSVDRATGESGVTDAFILSPSGEILAPGDRSGQRLQIDGVESLGDVRSFRSSTATNGDSVLAQPVSYRGRRVGVAVLRYRAGGALAAASMTLVFGTLLLGVAVVVSVLLLTRMTVGPIEELRSDVDALSEGRAPLSTDRSYRELSRLAQSVARLAARRAGPH